MTLANIYIPFDSNSLIEQQTTTLPTITGTPVIVPSVFANGLQMNGSTSASYAISISISTGLSIGFWLKSSNPGMVTGPGFSTLPLYMPVFTRATFTYSVGVVSASQHQFTIREETQQDGTNVLTAIFVGGTTATVSSNPYKTGEYHYFWITFDGTICHIWIDFVDQTASTSGTVPATLSASIAGFNINDNVAGNGYQIAKNNGIIDDLILFNSFQSTTVMQRAASYSGNYVATSSLQFTEELDQALVFDDPTTVQINAIASNRGNVYVARSDGSLLRGVKALWDSRRNFNTAKELSLLDFVTTKGETALELDGGSLLVTDEIITL